jgi:hypothetical protein
MHSFDATFDRYLRERIREEIERERNLVSDKPLPYEQYVHRVGRIDGLNRALQFCDEVEQRMQGIV